MLVQEQTGDIAIITNGGDGYLIVEILGEAKTYREAKEIMEDELDQCNEESEEEEDEDEDEED